MWCTGRVFGIYTVAACLASLTLARTSYYGPRLPKGYPGPERKPNIVFILTDDQDTELGSMSFMPKTARWLGEGGAHFHNAFVTTPMCCPSRSSMLTGMYVHNHHTYTNNQNCSSVYWQQQFEGRNFGTYLTDAGYRTGYFGKYLNEYQGTYIPPGWTQWVGLVRNTRFYNYTLNFNGQLVHHKDNYQRDYLTDLIANDSVTFLKQSKQIFPDRPVAMVLSMPAPHGPEDAAPQHQHLFPNASTHRTPSWNFAPNADKQWLLQHTAKMEPIHIAFTDMLHRKRLQTLQAVDDAVEKLCEELDALGELDNTYVVYTSDHGYHLGQYGLVKGKALPYEFDIRVPFYMRGPGIPPGVRVPNIALNIDLAPTFLDIAGVEVPDHMDGRSLLAMFDEEEDPSLENGNTLKRKKAWRDTFIVERGKVSNKLTKERARLEAHHNQAHLLQTKDRRLERECGKLEYRSPCGPNQEWECQRKADGTLRMYKCRQRSTGTARSLEADLVAESTDFRDVTKTSKHGPWRGCACAPGAIQMSRSEIRRQEQFLNDNLNKPELFDAKFLRYRLKRDVDMREWRRSRQNRRMRSMTPDYVNQGEGATECRVLADNSVVCSRTVYANRRRWRKQKQQVEETIADLKQRLEGLREIKEHLQNVRPEDEQGLASGEYNMRHPNATENYDPQDSEVDNLFETRPNSESEEAGPNSQMANVYYPSGKLHVTTDNARQGDQASGRYGTPVADFGDGPAAHGRQRNEGRRRGRNRNNRRFDDDYFARLSESWDRNRDARRDDDRGRDTETRYDDEIDDISYGDDYVDIEEEEAGVEEEFFPENYEDEDYEDEDYFDEEYEDNYGDEEYEDEDYEDQLSCDCESGRPLHDQREEVRAEREERRRLRKQEIQERKARKREGRQRRKGNRRDSDEDYPEDSEEEDYEDSDESVTRQCNSESMKCFEHNNDHWRTAPLWDLGPFCFCPNSNNNTYWCLRTINETHNFLYCEFITGFFNYYDLNRDPYQLRNAVRDLPYSTLTTLQNTLKKLKNCRGGRECTLRTRHADDRGSPRSNENLSEENDNNKYGRSRESNGRRWW